MLRYPEGSAETSGQGTIAPPRRAPWGPWLFQEYFRHEPQWEVTLGLETKDGQVENLAVMMTKENRDLVRE